MAYDVTNFNDYIARENQALTKELFTGSDTGKFALYMAGVKGSTSIPHISGDAVLQTGSCASPSGTTTIAEVILAVQAWTAFESFCQDDLQTKFPNTVLAPGSSNHDAPDAFEDGIVITKISSISETLENTYWQGNTASGDYRLFDGFIKKIDADSNVVSGNTSGANAITVANVIGLVDDVRGASPAKVKRSKDYVILVGDDVFDLYIQAEKNANHYHYSAEHDEGTYKIGGSAAKLQRVYGLDGTSRMFASVGKNFVVGSDVASESEVAEVFYDQTTDLVNMRVKGKSGVQIANADEIVEFTLA